MNHIERFYATIERRPVDRPAAWLGLPAEGSERPLLSYFNCADMNALKKRLDDDIHTVELPYHSPVSNAIYDAFKFAKEPSDVDNRTLTSPGFFEDYTDPDKVDGFHWPDPVNYIDPDECARVVSEVPEGYAVMAVLWSAHFQDACSAFGMETALMKMLTEPEMFSAVINRILEFYLKANDIFYRSTEGKVHAVLLGNDLGTQTGLMVSPGKIRQFVLPGIRKLVKQAKGYGLKVFYHSCGAIYDMIPDLIDAGVDVIHPIQALAHGMDPYRLQADFGDQVSFCGGVDAQQLLVNGTPESVHAKVKELCSIFPTGLLISPSHEAILPDIPPHNIEALFQALKEL